jgi:hypothetical protein
VKVNLGITSTTETKFDRAYKKIDNLRAGIVEELPSNTECYEYFPGGKPDLNSVICPQMIGMMNGVFDIQGVELTELFPDVSVTRLRGFLQECWGKALLAKP